MLESSPSPSPLPDLGDLVERFDHVSIAVNKIKDALSMVALLAGDYHDGGESSRGGFRWAQFSLPGPAKLELIEPIDPGDSSNFLVRFLADKGEGMHHFTLKVSSIADAAARAAELGMDVIGLDVTDQNWKEAFVHPRSANGVLVQLAEWTDGDPSGRKLADVLGDS